MFVASIEFDRLEAGLGQVDAGVDALGEVDLELFDADEAARAIVAIERQARRLKAAQVALLDGIQQSGAHLADGHFSARVMMRHHGQLSGREASHRGRVAEMLRSLSVVAEAYGEGSVGTDQVWRLARVWGNRRVRDRMPECELHFLAAAREMEFPDFDRFCRDWERTVDEDGAEARNSRRWERRDIRPVQDYNGLWDLRGRLLSLDGAEFAETLDCLADGERLADVAETKEAHGEEWRQHLPRTSAQLRYDAFMILVRRGAEAAPGTGAAEVVTNVVIDQATYERELAKLVGAKPEPLDPIDPNRFSRTINGTWIDPHEVAARSLVGHVRRVIVNASGTVIDKGRKQRLFTGSARDAALLQALRCYWKACWVKATACQIDHLTPWAGDGLTNPGNGAPGCGTHNRLKEQGFHAWRDPSGEWRIQRPDGSEVPSHTEYWPESDEYGKAA